MFVATATAQGDQSPTACIGNDLAELEAASKADPNNIGLRMRLVRKLLIEIPKTDNRRRSKAMLDNLQAQLDSIKSLDPEFTYVYRVLARQHERKGEFTKVLEVLDDYSKVTELDYDMRNMRVRALLRLADNKDKPDPKRLEEAADYVANWFSSGTAPVFSETLASTQTWMIDKPFRKALLKRYKGMFKTAPKNINLVISYASALYVAGKYESAWGIMRDAELIGLCDDVMGGRHPLIHFLEWRCPEDEDDERYSGLDLDKLRERVAADQSDLSLRYRLAVRLKAKAYAGERLVRKVKEVIEDTKLDVAEAERKSGQADKVKSLNDKIGRYQKEIVRIEKQVKEAYEEALPLALGVRKENPQIDSVALLLADIYTKLENEGEAVRYLKESIERVPFFVPLRDKLAAIHFKQKKYDMAAEELAGVCRLVSCRAAEWEEGPTAKALPIPTMGREKVIADMAKTKEGLAALKKAFGAAIQKDARNPNLHSFLAMAHFFGGDKKAASASMRKAESLGVCGQDGHEHELAVAIYSQE